MLILEKILFPPMSLNRRKLAEKLKGKSILITGASSGIGEQVAILLAQFDVHLLLVARREEKLLLLKEELEKKRAKVSVFPADLRKEEEINAFLKYIHDEFSPLDIVVNNAGHSIHRSIFQALDRYHDFKRTMKINYLAPVQLLLSVIPILAKRQGQIINVSTVNVLLFPFPEWSAYQASKAAFDTWFRSVSPELKAANIDTTSIYFPLVRTAMIEPTTAYKNMPAMDPVQAAKMICKAMYTKQKMYKPWWLFLGELFSVAFRRPLEWALDRSYKKRRKGI